MIKATLETEPKYLTTNVIDQHIQILDEPVSLGGNNQGPTPVQTVYSALAGCISMTIRMYAEKKRIPLKKVKVEIDASTEKVKADDNRFKEHPQMVHKGKVRFIHAVIEVFGDLSDNQIEKLDTIAGKCPVHRMLKNGSYITHETKHMKQ